MSNDHHDVVPARVLAQLCDNTLRVVLCPDQGLADGGIPVEIPLDLVPPQLRTPNTDVSVTLERGEVTAVGPIGELTHNGIRQKLETPMTMWDTLGIPVDVAELVPYDPAWVTAFEWEAQRIRQACGEHLATVEHIGSTSVPGLAAKPIIDMMPGLRSAADGPEIVGPMEDLGYEFRGEYGIPGRFYFVRHHEGRRVVNAHAFPIGDDNWKRHLFFRNHLRQNSQVAEEYEQLKRELASRFGGDVFAYTNSKTEFIRSIERLAGEQR